MHYKSLLLTIIAISVLCSTVTIVSLSDDISTVNADNSGTIEVDDVVWQWSYTEEGTANTAGHKYNFTLTSGDKEISYHFDYTKPKKGSAFYKLMGYTVPESGELIIYNPSTFNFKVNQETNVLTTNIKELHVVGNVTVAIPSGHPLLTSVKKLNIESSTATFSDSNTPSIFSNIEELILPANMSNVFTFYPDFLMTSTLKKIVVCDDTFDPSGTVNNMPNLEEIVFKNPNCSVSYIYGVDLKNCPKLTSMFPANGDVITLLSSDLDNLVIDNSIKKLSFTKNIAINTIYIEDDNQNFMLYGGALYQASENGFKIIYVMPDVVELVINSQTSGISEKVGNDKIFQNCKNLRSIDIESGASFQIYDYMFIENSSLETISFGDNCNVTSIGSHVFGGNQSSKKTAVILKELINIPSTVTSIGAQAFYGCTCLETVTFETGSQLASIGDKAFYGCISLGTLTIPSTTTLGIDVFSKCTMLENIVTTGAGSLSFHDGLIINGDAIYYALPRWESVRIPSNVTSINEGAFNENVAKEIFVDEANATYAAIGSVVTSKDGSTLILVPNGASVVNIPSQVKTIPTKTFENSIARTVYWKSTGDLTVEQYALSNGRGLSQIKQLTVITDGNLTIGKQFKLPITKLKLECSTLSTSTIEFTKPYTADLTFNAYDGTGFLNENVAKLQIENKDLSKADIRSLFCVGKTYGEISIMQHSGSGWTSLDEVSVLTGHQLTIGSDVDGFEISILGISLRSNDDPEVAFTFSTPEGIGSIDVTATVGQDELVAAENVYAVVMSSDRTVTIAEKAAADENAAVTFVYGNGIENKVVQVGKDRTLRSSVIAGASAQTLDGYTFEGWYKTSTLEEEYVQGTVSGDLFLFAKWSSNTGLVITMDDLYGLVVKETDSGIILRSGDRVDSGTTVTVTYSVPNGFDFLGWKINDGLVADADAASKVKTKDLVIDANTSIGVSYRYYSTSNSLINQVATSMPTEDIALRWSYSGQIDATMNIWTGFPSIPLIVDDSVYIRINNDLLRINIATGEVIGSAHTDNSTVAAYYHYLGYGNGYVFDYATHSVYNTDLSKSCPMDRPYTAVFYDGGFYFGLVGSTVYRFTIVESGESFSVSPSGTEGWADGVATDWFSMYGTTSSPVFANGKVYFIEASGDSRSISYIDIATGEKQAFTNTKWNGMLMDDGWLTYAEVDGQKYLFTTMYNIGLFSTSNGQTWVVCIKLNDDGTFANEWRYLNLSETGAETGTAGSAFVVFQGRGYVNAHGTMFVIDVAKLLTEQVASNKIKTASNAVIYKENSVASHGSIVLNVSEYDRTGNVYVYLLPYNPSDQAVYIFTDNAQKTSASGYFKTSPAGASYGSQAVRAGPNSELLWYTDTGKLYCYAPISENTYTFFIDYGEDGALYQASGLNQSDALMDALDAFNVTYNIDPVAGITSINAVSNSTATTEYWNLYKLDGSEWALAGIYSAEDSGCHVFLIHYGTAATHGDNLDTGKLWTYMDEGYGAMTYIVGTAVPEGAIGKPMSTMGITDSTEVSGNSVTSVITITNKLLDIDPEVKVYAKFSDNSFMQFTTKVNMIDGVAKLNMTIAGNSTPCKLLVSVVNADGDQLMEYRADLGTM